MRAPGILYVRVEEKEGSLLPPRFLVSERLEDFSDSGPVATYRLEKLGHLNVQRHLTNLLPAAAPAPVNKRR